MGGGGLEGETVRGEGLRGRDWGRGVSGRIDVCVGGEGGIKCF